MKGVKGSGKDRAHKTWSEAETEYLQNNYGVVTDERIARRLHRTVLAIRLRANRLGIRRTDNFCTASQVGRIVGVANSTVASWIDKGLLKGQRSKAVHTGKGRSVWEIRWEDFERFLVEHPTVYDVRRIDPNEWTYFANIARRAQPGKPPTLMRYWTPEEDAYLLRNHARMTYAQIGRALRRTTGAVRARCKYLRADGRLLPPKKLGSFKPKRKWTPEEDAYLCAHWRAKRSREIARHLGRTEYACWTRAHRLGLTPGRGYRSDLYDPAHNEVAA